MMKNLELLCLAVIFFNDINSFVLKTVRETTRRHMFSGIVEVGYKTAFLDIYLSKVYN